MTKLLEEAFTKAGQLPDDEQNLVAQLVLDEIESERAWDERFARNPEGLRQLADQAAADHAAGRTDVLNPDEL